MELWIRKVTAHYPWLIRGSCWINNSKQRTKGNCYANCSPPRPDKGQITGFQFHPESLNQLPWKEDHMQSWKLPIVVVLSLDLRDSTEIIPAILHLFSFLSASFLFLFPFSIPPPPLYQKPFIRAKRLRNNLKPGQDSICGKVDFVAAAPWQHPDSHSPCSCRGSSSFWGFFCGGSRSHKPLCFHIITAHRHLQQTALGGGGVKQDVWDTFSALPTS